MSEKPKINVAVLGVTGSVGSAAIKVLTARRDKFRVIGVSGCGQIAKLAAVCAQLDCPRAVTADPARLAELRALLPDRQCSGGAEALAELARLPELDVLLCATVGVGGLTPVLAALDSGKRVALASKEILVMAGELVVARARPGALTPVDSEHAGVHQCLAGRRPEEIRKVLLTASGGPFREWPLERIQHATAAEALRHPTWNMGRKITIDSASMMNKALELVEAHYLFGLPPEQLGALIHPQSRIHALVELADGSFIAQLGWPDMQLPVAYALSFPERLTLPLPPYDWTGAPPLSFEEPDRRRFPSFDFADAALRSGGTLPAVMNAANDVAVARFLRGELPFGGIWKVVEQIMARHTPEPQSSVEQLVAVDAEARRRASEVGA